MRTLEISIADAHGSVRTVVFVGSARDALNWATVLVEESPEHTTVELSEGGRHLLGLRSRECWAVSRPAPVGSDRYDQPPRFASAPRIKR